MGGISAPGIIPEEQSLPNRGALRYAIVVDVQECCGRPLPHSLRLRTNGGARLDAEVIAVWIPALLSAD